jgi:drug/metabolite transporter (DMT)-like permease
MSLVGSYVALSKPLALAFPIFLLAWLRFGIGAIAMVRWLPKRAGEPPLSPGVRKLLFLESLFGNFLFSIFMLFGVSMTSAVSAGVIMASMPAVVAVLSWLLLRERIGLRIWAAIVCAVVGIGLLGLAKPQHDAAPGDSTSWLGNLLIFAAVACEAIYAVIAKKLTGVLGPKRITSIINLWGLVLMTPLGAYAAWHFDFHSVHVSIWVLLVFYGLAASVWTAWLWMTGLRAVPASQAGVFTVMLPVSAALVGVIALGESLSLLQGLAFAAALAGVVLATLPTRH